MLRTRVAIGVALLLLAFVGTAVPGMASTPAARPPAAPAFKLVCGALTGHYRCMSLVRTSGVVHDAAAAHGGFGPADLRAAYELNPRLGAGQTVAVVDAYDDPSAEADMNVYRSFYGLPPCTTANGCFRKVNEQGAAAPLPRPDPLWNLEESLDLDMVSAVCPRCHILLVEASSADETSTTNNATSDLGASVDTAVRLGATEVSNSYGSVGPELSEASEDHYYNHPGVVVTVSAGDFGYGVVYPASSSYVISVGGTSLTADASRRGWTEAAWGEGVLSQVPELGGGTGSGCSKYEKKPAWQKDTGCAGRTVADISAVADPATGVAVYDSQPAWAGWNVVGGTSASSPIVASIFALAGGAHGVAYPAQTLYGHAKRFFDVTTGSNASAPDQEGCGYLCTGMAGYDGPTGLGTPNGIKGFKP
jgi:subtilase family serine protease